MKVGIFSDAHYSSQEVTCGIRYNSRSLEKIKRAYAWFQKENCELIICLGDLIDKEALHCREIANLKEIAEVIQQSGVPTVCVMGNHDAFAFTEEEFYTILGNCIPSNRYIEGKKLIFLDACYFKSGRRYMPGDSNWTDTCLPEHERYQLEAELDEAYSRTYIFMHQNIDPTVPDNHRLANADEVCRIVEKYGSVKAVIQGHYHPGKKTVLNGVEYITVPAMCEQEEAYYILNI